MIDFQKQTAFKPDQRGEREAANRDQTDLPNGGLFVAGTLEKKNQTCSGETPQTLKTRFSKHATFLGGAVAEWFNALLARKNKRKAIRS